MRTSSAEALGGKGRIPLLAVVFVACCVESSAVAQRPGTPGIVRVAVGGSIQAAIDLVPNGGTVIIAPGVFNLEEPLIVSGKVITVKGGGASGRDRTMLVGPRPTEIVSANAARGLLTFEDNGGGKVQGLMLRGFDTCILGIGGERSVSARKTVRCWMLSQGWCSAK